MASIRETEKERKREMGHLVSLSSRQREREREKKDKAYHCAKVYSKMENVSYKQSRWVGGIYFAAK